MAPLKTSEMSGSGSRTRTCSEMRFRRENQHRSRQAGQKRTAVKQADPEPDGKLSTRRDENRGSWTRPTAGFLALALALLCGAGCGDGDPAYELEPESAAGELAEAAPNRGPHKVPIRLPIRLRFAEDVIASGRAAWVEAQARAWNEALGFQAVLLPVDPGQGCMVDVTFDDVYLDAHSWAGSSAPLGPCAGHIRLEYDSDPREFQCAAAHELGHLLTATSEHNSDTHSVRFHSCGTVSRAITADDVAAVLEDGRLDQRWLNGALL